VISSYLIACRGGLVGRPLLFGQIEPWAALPYWFPRSDVQTIAPCEVFFCLFFVLF